MKAALLISGADKQRYGRLKEDLANNYLLGSNQYPDTFEKALQFWETTKGSGASVDSGATTWEG